MALLDVPTNWRRWTAWQQGRGEPDPLEGSILMFNPECAFVAAEGFDTIELRDWLRANCRGRVTLHGRWDFTTFAYRVERQLIGLNLWFDDADEAFFAKMRWG